MGQSTLPHSHCGVEGEFVLSAHLTMQQQPQRLSWTQYSHAEQQKGGFVPPFRAPAPLNNSSVFSHPSASPALPKPPWVTLENSGSL